MSQAWATGLAVLAVVVVGAVALAVRSITTRQSSGIVIVPAVSG